MNLIDYEVTKVLSEPKNVQYFFPDGTLELEYWKVEIEYSDDAGSGQMKKEIFFTEESAKECRVGMIYQH